MIQQTRWDVINKRKPSYFSSQCQMLKHSNGPHGQWGLYVCSWTSQCIAGKLYSLVMAHVQMIKDGEKQKQLMVIMVYANRSSVIRSLSPIHLTRTINSLQKREERKKKKTSRQVDKKGQARHKHSIQSEVKLGFTNSRPGYPSPSIVPTAHRQQQRR